nr:hypothetical protein [Tanacetum cinerariifolium]
VASLSWGRWGRVVGIVWIGGKTRESGVFEVGGKRGCEQWVLNRGREEDG